jgi:hypothetical protein
MLFILFLSPIGSLGRMLEPMGNGASFRATREPMGTDLLSSFSLAVYTTRNLCTPINPLVNCLQDGSLPDLLFYIENGGQVFF